VPSFSRTPARSTEPAVGASVWASGSQVWSGKSGTLMAKAMAKAANNHRSAPVVKLDVHQVGEGEGGAPSSGCGRRPER
jgi:hypothetical protein